MTNKKSSDSLVGDLLRRAASPEVLAGVAGAAAAAHFTKHALERKEDDESETPDEPKDETADESPDDVADSAEDEEDDDTEAEDDEAATEDGAENEDDEDAEDEDIATEDSAEDEEHEEDDDTEAEDEEDDDTEAEDEDEDDDDDTATEMATANGHSRNGHSVRGEPLDQGDDRLRALARAQGLAEQLTGRAVDSFSGLSRQDGGWRVEMEVVEVSRVPSTTDVLASYEVIVNGDGDLVDFRRGRRYYRNATDDA